MKKRMIIVTALIMGTLGAECVSVQASDTLPELTKDNALEQMMKAGETDSLVSNHKSYEATCEYILQNTKVYDYEDSEVMYVDMYGTTQMLYKNGELKYGKEGDEYLSCLYIDEADGNADDLISFYTDETIEEEVTDMKEDGDTIIIQTKVPEELTQSTLNSQGDGESYTEGDWISMEYVVASDDYRPLKHTQILNHKDGTSEEASKMEFSYGVDRSEDVADLCEKYEEAEKVEGDVRNVTVTAAPGTELEKDYAITVPADNHVWIMLHDDSSYYVLYTDKECKELHEPEENVKGDTHLYAEIRSYEDYEETEDKV